MGLVVEGNGSILDELVDKDAAAVEEGSSCWLGVAVGCMLSMAGDCSQFESAGCIGVGGSVEMWFGESGLGWRMKFLPFASLAVGKV
jgi:hypothetical protein